MKQIEHEKSLVRAFVVSNKRDRIMSLLASDRRQTVLDSLYHFHDLDDRFVEAIPPSLQTPHGISETLRRYGAPNHCWVISAIASLDGREMPLDEVLERIVGFGDGTLISCVPGKLAFFEGEEPEDRCILRRFK